MQQILIKKSKSDLMHQYDFLKSIENSKYWELHKLIVKIFIGLNLAYFSLLTLTGTDILITLKAILFILIGLSWIIALAYMIGFLIKLRKRNSNLNKIINQKLKEEKDYYLTFDETKLIIQANDIKLELEWSYFKAYLESNIAIFLFPEGSLYSSYSFSASEIGDQNFEKIKTIAKRKLKQLEK